MPIIVDPTLAPGSSLSLRAIWLNVAADPSDVRRFDLNLDLQPASETRADVRVVANGATRMVRRAGRLRSYAVSGRALRADVPWLEDHEGVTLCLRDHVGRKMFGAYVGLSTPEPGWTDAFADFSFTFTALTYSEAV